MDKLVKTTLICNLILSLFLSPVSSFAGGGGDTQEDHAKEQRTDKRDLRKGFYVVIGAFNVYENVQRYTKELTKQGYHCDFAFSDTHHRYYAYMYYSDSIFAVKEELHKVRTINHFKEAWILKIGRHLAEKRLDENVDVAKEIREKEETDSKEHLETTTHHSNKNISKTHNAYNINVTPFSPDLKPVTARIKVVNGDKAVVLKTIESQKTETIHCPKSYSQVVELICDDALGYQKKVLYLDLSSPVNDTTKAYVKVEGDQINVSLPLEPLKAGDIMTLFNVFFFPNTNILRTKSNYELQKLLELLKENPTLNVMIHGHVNGNSSGPVTRLKEDCSDFFNPSDTEVMNVSALKLSELRSETIKYYLIRNGIDEKRLQTKGWGGKKMLYKENSPQYEYNVRVEVEVLSK